MLPYQKQFIDFALQHGVLQFGEFVLKSGRISPYFFNAGGFNSGAALHRLGQFYAQALSPLHLTARKQNSMEKAVTWSVHPWREMWLSSMM